MQDHAEKNVVDGHFSETQLAYSKHILEITKRVLGELEVPLCPLLTPNESISRGGVKKDIPDNYLILHRYSHNAYRLSFGINRPDPDVLDRDLRIAIYDDLMYRLKDAGIKVYNQIPNRGPMDMKRHFSSWEFLGVTDEFRQEESTNQETILEISELIAKKLGLSLDL